jgi:hypothetical protein
MKKFILYASVATAVFAAGCDDFGDTNVSPNASLTPLTSALLTNSLTQLGTSVTGGPALASGFYAQYFTQTQYTETSLYTEQDANWSVDISGPIADLQAIIDINSDPETAKLAALQGPNANQIAIARILKAYRFSVLTDRYGDMPYFEALDKDNLTPVFNTQEEIYTDIFKELDEAVAQFEDSAVPVKGDILYSDTAKVDPVRQIMRWKRFANSWRLILALRVSEVAPELGKAQFNDAMASEEGVFNSNFDNAVLKFPGDFYKNPWFAIAADQGIANTIVNVLEDFGDNRLFAFGNPVSGNLTGFDYGLPREKALKYAAQNPSWSLILHSDYRKETSNFFVFTFADVLLALAEARERNWITGSPNSFEYYQTAIIESWDQWGVYDGGDFTAYISNPDVAFVPGDATALDKIALQRWLTFYPNGPQGWSEWRRTGVPALVPTPFAVNVSKQIPRRFKYPSVEYGYNAANINDAAARFNAGDNDNSLVWWNK